MTREEAIDMVKYILEIMPKEPPTECDYVEEWFYEDNKIRKALDMAIEALEQVPTIKNDLAVDCIDRVELLKAMNTYDKFGNDSNERLVFLSTPALQNRYVPYVHYDEMVNCVKGMPSVTPQEPIKGHWEVVSDGYSDNAYICECSECKDTVWVYKDADRKWNYCPNCGADMREQDKWIPIKTRKLTHAEEQDMLENSNSYYTYMFDCQLPEDGEEVLVTTSAGEVTTTTFYDEGLDGCYFECYEDDGDIIAWMPKPKSYKAERK